MKTKTLYCMMALCAGSFALAPNANAQDVVIEDQSVAVTEFNCDNSNHYFQSWRDNWFIQLGAGVNQPFVERGVGPQAKKTMVNRKIMTATYNVGVGHWFSPYLGMRLNALGGVLHWNTPTEAQPNNGHVSARHINLNAELMWDMSNSIAGVNPNRVVSVVPFVGFGGDYTWHIKDSKGNPAAATNTMKENGKSYRTTSWTLPVNAGVQLRFRLAKYVDFFAEARASFYGDNWNGDATGHSIDGDVAVLGGFNFNIGGRSWNTYNECNSMAQLAQMNNEVNTLRAQNLAQAQTIAALESQLPCPETVKNDCPDIPLLSTVRFTINSDKIIPTEEVNIYNMAQWLKANPNQNIVICGYADKDTGTSEYNMALSQRRADAVKNALVSKYGINPDRLTVKYDGSNVQPYGENDWNRIVIFTDKSK